jgi:hypothetical protein
VSNLAKLMLHRSSDLGLNPVTSLPIIAIPMNVRAKLRSGIVAGSRSLFSCSEPIQLFWSGNALICDKGKLLVSASL